MAQSDCIQRGAPLNTTRYPNCTDFCDNDNGIQPPLQITVWDMVTGAWILRTPGQCLKAYLKTFLKHKWE